MIELIKIGIDKKYGDMDFEISSQVEGLSTKGYEELKSMIITTIGTLEEMRRNVWKKNN